jgi:hypothetical protein
MRAEVAPSRQAVPAASADEMPLPAHDVTGVNVDDARANVDHLAYELMADGQGYGNGPLRPGVPAIDVNVRTADSGAQNPN